MTLTINDSSMTSDRTAHTARHAPDRNGWEVSWLPGQTLDRNTAITAMILADTTAEPDLHEGHRLWPHIQSWAARTRPDRTRRDRPGRPAARRHRPPPGTSQSGSQTARQPTDDQHDSPHHPSASAQFPATRKHRVTDV